MKISTLCYVPVANVKPARIPQENYERINSYQHVQFDVRRFHRDHKNYISLDGTCEWLQNKRAAQQNFYLTYTVARSEEGEVSPSHVYFVGHTYPVVFR